MRKTAILIGFHYPSSKNFRPLNGSLIDIYLVYKHFNSLGFEVIILGDFCKPVLPVKKAILNGHVDIEVINFCDSNEEKIIKLKDKKSFKRNIKNALTHDPQKLVIYFSGHGETCGTKMLLPDNTYVKWKEWYSWFDKYTSKTTEMCYIMDCCFPPTFDLPYKLKKGSFKSTIPSRLICRPGVYKVLLFASSSSNTSSQTSDSGSLFTRFLIGKWGEIQKNLPVCITLESIKEFTDRSIDQTLTESSKEISEENTQKMHIYSSHIIPPFLPFWLWNKYKNVE